MKWVKSCNFQLRILLLIIFEVTSGFFYDCFHAYFIFDFILDVLIVIYIPGIYFIDMKLS